MVGKTLDLNALYDPLKDSIAVNIAIKWQEWWTMGSPWRLRCQELRNYLFATDTSTTSNKSLPWKNSTTTPKLTQIRDNLHANYMQGGSYARNNWFVWEGDGSSDEIERKRKSIEGYMQTKFRQDKTARVVSRLNLDWIDSGNCFGTVVWVDESTEDKDTGEVKRGYVGPRWVRISPNDLVFNPVAADFKQSPKIVRVLKNLGELYEEADKMPADSDAAKTFRAALDKGKQVRQQVALLSTGDTLKSESFQFDGFGSLQSYFGSGYVELLTFYGDLYDIDGNKFYKNHQITIMDRAFTISVRPCPDWTTHPGIFHCGWRERPDNLYAMGPLDNLVGMQYRIDHLENLKADVFDMIALPITKVKGYVEDFVFEPGSRIYCGDEGDVEAYQFPHEALNADTQIEVLEQRMEAMAGAPKEAMGIRSPGEKTKFEVQKLDNASSRIFQAKLESFDAFMEDMLNFSLQLSRRNMSASDVARTLDSDIDAVIFSTVTKEDITANGVLRPVGAKHYAEQANALQNLTSLSNSPVFQDQAVLMHISGKNLAKAVTDLADLGKYKLYGENIRVGELAETQRLMNATKEAVQVEDQTPAGVFEGDPAEPATRGLA